MQHLTYFDSIILGIVEGLTEFLPVSSTGHLTITEKLLGLTVDNPAVTAYTAIIQLGAIAATVIYFFKDIVRLLGAWFRGLRSAQERTHHDYQLAWAV
ncbi:MAG: undecaprenyl-diphosphate phosphatase, partial [Dermatophilaceae bacterium]